MAADETNSHTMSEGMDITQNYDGDYTKYQVMGKKKIKTYRKGGTFGQRHDWEPRRPSGY